MLSDNVFNNVT